MEFLRKSREALEARLPEDSLTLVESLNTNNIKVSNVISTVMMINGHLRMAAQSDLLAEPSITVATCASAVSMVIMLQLYHMVVMSSSPWSASKPRQSNDHYVDLLPPPTDGGQQLVGLC